MNYDPYPQLSAVDHVIFLNATSMKKLACDRAFQFHNPRGYKLAAEDPILTLGKAIHKYAEEFTRSGGKHAEALAKACDAYPTIEARDMINYCAGRSRINLPPPITLADNSLAVEFFFRVPWRRYVVGARSYVIILCGTLDMLAQDSSGVLWVVDYKSSRKWKVEDINADYEREMQFRFYMWNIVRHGASFLPLSAFNAATAGRIATQVVGVQVGSSKSLYWHKCPPIMMNDGELAEFDELMDGVAEKILALTMLTDVATPNGKTNNACRYCDFGALCYSRTSVEVAAAERLFVQKTYNPQHHNE